MVQNGCRGSTFIPGRGKDEGEKGKGTGSFKRFPVGPTQHSLLRWRFFAENVITQLEQRLENAIFQLACFHIQ